MDTSNRLPAKKTLSQPDNLDWVRQSLADSSGLSLKQFCIQTCEHFGFLNSRDEPQIGNCALALRALDEKGLISLQKSLGYKSSGIGRPHEPRCLDAPVPQPSGLPEDAGKIGELKVVMVTTPEQLLRLPWAARSSIWSMRTENWRRLPASARPCAKSGSATSG